LDAVLEEAPGLAPDEGEQAPPTPRGPVAVTRPEIGWVAEVWVDPLWHGIQEVDDDCPEAGPPLTVELVGDTHLVGRRSVSREILPEIDCGQDTGVSREHARVIIQDGRCWVEDLESANGTYLSNDSNNVPEEPIPSGELVEVRDAMQIYVGAWTRICVRREAVAGPR
jgi:hypothetical protein